MGSLLFKMTYHKELWEFILPVLQEGGKAYKGKRVTKGELVRRFQKKGGSMSPKIDTEVREGADNVVEGVVYEIVNIEDIRTDVQQLEGIRVTLLSAKAQEGNVVLWKRPITGKSSKLGVFIIVLGGNTDTWLHKWVIFRVWQPRNRVIEVVEAPVPKAPRPKAKGAT